MSFDKACGRLRLEVSDNGLSMHDYGHGAQIHYRDGWNDACPIKRVTLSVDELRDLQYLIGRALQVATSCSKPSPL